MSNSPSAPPLPEIRLAGFLNAGLGLGEAGRRIARSLHDAGVPILTHSWEKSDVATVPFQTTGNANAGHGPGISLLSMNGDQIPSFLQSAGPSFTDQKYVISVWFWELQNLAPGMEEGFRYVDEVWAATPFIQQALSKHSNGIPVHLFPQPIAPPAGNAEKAHARFPFDGRFVFLFPFDYQSCAKRKNPGGLCQAFDLAFPHPSPDGPLCVIKSINANHHPVDHALLKRRWSHRPDILFMDEFLSTTDRDLLCWRADACISLHRSEGLGVSMLEGMAIGKPCIATAWSGNTSFMLPDNSWLIPWEEVPVGRGSLHYEASQRWAEPDPAAAAAAMREVVAAGPKVAARAAAGQAYVMEHHHSDAAGRVMRQLLEKAATQKPRAKPPLSGRRAFGDALKTLKDFEDRLRKAPKSSRWQLGTNLTNTRQDLLQLTQLQRQALTQSLGAIKHLDQQAKSRHQHLLRENQRLSDQLAAVIAQLPPVS